MQVRRILAFCLTATIAASSPALAQRNNDNEKQKQQQQQQAQRNPQQQQDTEALVRLVDGVAAGTQPAPADVPIAWESNHFVKGQSGDTYIPFTLAIDRSKLARPGVALYVRVVDKKAPPPPPAPEAQKNEREKTDRKDQPPPARVMYAWDNIHFIDVPESGKLQRAIQLKPGEYEAFIGIKERATTDKNAPAAKIGLLRRDIVVPDYNAAALTTSSVILAQTVEPMTSTLSPAEQEANPYVFGPMRIVPSADGKFPKAAELSVIFWIYGAQAAASGKPDVTIDFNFYTRQGENEKYFNKTQPQQLNAETLPPEFSVAAGHQLPGSLVVPLASFPAGDYRLEIKVTDKPSGKSVTQSANFSVLPS